jgi:hypothetical protein
MVLNELKGFFFCLMVRIKIPSVCLFCEMHRKGIPNIFIFGTRLRRSESFSLLRTWFGTNSESFNLPRMVRKKSQSSEYFSLLRNGLELNSELFIVRRTARTRILSLSIPRNWRNSEGMNQISICSVFRGIIFFSENGNPT